MIGFVLGVAVGAATVLIWPKLQASNAWLRALRAWTTVRGWFTP